MAARVRRRSSELPASRSATYDLRTPARTDCRWSLTPWTKRSMPSARPPAPAVALDDLARRDVGGLARQQRWVDPQAVGQRHRRQHGGRVPAPAGRRPYVVPDVAADLQQPRGRPVPQRDATKVSCLHPPQRGARDVVGRAGRVLAGLFPQARHVGGEAFRGREVVPYSPRSCPIICRRPAAPSAALGDRGEEGGVDGRGRRHEFGHPFFLPADHPPANLNRCGQGPRLVGAGGVDDAGRAAVLVGKPPPHRGSLGGRSAGPTVGSPHGRPPASASMSATACSSRPRCSRTAAPAALRRGRGRRPRYSCAGGPSRCGPCRSRHQVRLHRRRKASLCQRRPTTASCSRCRSAR